MKKNEYRCDNCNKVYQKGWSNVEAEKEAEDIFGKAPIDWVSGIAIICDDCFKLIIK